MAKHRKLLNYPEPLKGPDVPYKNDRKPNPPLRGVVLVAAAFIMESFRFIREMIWRNAGFGSLRNISDYIAEYEPWFEPQVVPLLLPDSGGDSDDNGNDAEANKDKIGPEPSEPAAAEQRPVVYPEPKKYYSVADYNKLFLSGALTPTAVAEALLPLIRRDVPHPSEHSVAWFETNVNKVLEAARASTWRYQQGQPLSPLDGVPTAVKDEYDMAGYHTNLGSRNIYASAADANLETTWCVRRLEAAGAVVLGKLSMHEFGLDTTGNNPIYGTPRNPYNRDYYTGGSSSGTGYAVAAGLIPIGLGSDGGGSIRIPSSMCGVFGLKPTHGRLSFHPGQNHCVTCACLGPMASDVASLAAVFRVISEPHHTSPFPPLSLSLSRPPPQTPSSKLLGIPTDWFSRSTPAIQTACNALLRRLTSPPFNYTTVPITIPFLPEGQIAHALTVLSDAATLLPDPRGLTPANRILLALGRVTPSTDYLLAQKLRRALMQHLSWLWSAHPGMMIVTPTTACEGWPIRGAAAELKYGVNDGDHTLQSMEYVWLANFCGLPSVSVPAGFVGAAASLGAGGSAGGDGGDIPIGLMATGEWCAEEQLLRFAADAEAAGGELRRRPPNWVDVVERAREVEVRE